MYTLFPLAAALPLALAATPYYFPETSDVPVKFKISVDEAIVEEALDKAAKYRPSTDLLDDINYNWIEGPPRAEMIALAEHWVESYDWYEHEEAFNEEFTHWAITIDGGDNYTEPVPLHFIHERSYDKDAIPLLLLHGWPSTHREWSKVIKPLSRAGNGTASYHVVAPDLPGFGFSPAPTVSGLNGAELGVIFDKLMRELGYEQYGIVTTDLGWFVGMEMMFHVPDSLIGHFTDFFLLSPNATDLERYEAGETTEEEYLYITSVLAFLSAHSGYMQIHTQQPLAIAQALTDTPVGMAGWVWHLMHTVSDGFEYTLDEIITDAMLLWIPETYSNIRHYAEAQLTDSYPVTTTPLGVAHFGFHNGPFPELEYAQQTPAEWIERSSNLQYYQILPSGGHFPAVSVPDTWTEQVRIFFENHV